MAGISAKGRDELARIAGRGKRTVTVSDAARELGVPRVDAAKRLARWAEQGWLRRASRGVYIPVPVDADDPLQWSEDPLVIADAVWPPCFFTGWTAANHWGLTEQIFRTTIVKSAGRVRRSEMHLLDHTYLLVHVDEADFWGLATIWRDERRVAIADPTRTVIDVLDAPRLGGGMKHVAEIVAAYLDDHDRTALVEYGDRLGNGAVFKRLGYLLEQLAVDDSDLIEACCQRVSSGISPLDPSGPREGTRVSRWGLRLNVRLQERDAT